MKVELTRFRVKAGKTAKVDEWLAFLNDNMSDVLLTLENEKMFVETIFREELAGVEYLYWYSIQGHGAKTIEESNHWVDKKHLEFWKECIDNTYQPVDMNVEVVMISEKTRKTIH